MILAWAKSFVIEVVDIQCSKLFKGVCSAVNGTVHYKDPLKSFDKSRA